MIRSLHSKKERLASGLTILEGEKIIVDALHSGIKMESAVGTEDFWTRHTDLIHNFATVGIDTMIATPKQMALLTVTEHPAGLIAIVKRPCWQEEMIFRDQPNSAFLGLLTVGIQDPGNLGTIIRTMAAAAGNGMWSSIGDVEVASPKTLRASAGAAFRLPVVETLEPLKVLRKCQELNIQTLAAVPKCGKTYTAFDLTAPTLIVLGGEGGGLDPTLIAACNQSIQIPMSGGTDSLNVAVAGAILIYEAVRQRRLAMVVKRRGF